MPTGYTSAVQTGEIISLQQFAMQCARQFGALITMRDEPHDAPIPEAFSPSSYHKQRADEALARLRALEAMSPSQAQAECQRDYSRRMSAWRTRCDARAIHRVRYQDMLSQVAAWTPPTGDHTKLHEFMMEQLQWSIEHDCTPLRGFDDMPNPPRWPEWLAKERGDARRSYVYHRNEHQRELSRTEERNRWLAALRASF